MEASVCFRAKMGETTELWKNSLKKKKKKKQDTDEIMGLFGLKRLPLFQLIGNQTRKR